MFALLVGCFVFVSAGISPASLGQWAQGNGVRTHPGIGVDQSLLTITALEDIKGGEELLSIPTSLTYRDALAEDDPIIVSLKEKAASSTVDQRVKLSLSILRHKTNRVSAWYPWLSAIPSTSNSILHFSEEDVDLLKGFDVYGRVSQYRKLVHSAWEEFIQPAVGATSTESDFVTAYALVSGRRTILQFSNDTSENTQVILPFISCATHSNTPNSVIRTRVLQESPIDKLFDTGIAEFALIALADIPKGSQITLNFGFADNYEGLVAQGVVQDHDELDSLTFIVQDPSNKEVLAALEKIGLQRLEFRVTPISIPISLLQYLRITNGANVDDSVAFERLTKGSSISLDNDRKVFQELLTVLARLRSSWTTTVEEDVQLLPTLSEAHRQIAVHYRIREKGVVFGVEKIIKELWAAWLYQQLPEITQTQPVEQQQAN